MITIMRGFPGSGKSTIAQTLGVPVFCADDFFMDENGTYNYDPARIKEAHEWCRKSVEMALAAGQDCVVDNTHTRRWEYQPYIDVAARMGHEVSIIVATGNYRNIHGVPDEVIQKMRERWED